MSRFTKCITVLVASFIMSFGLGGVATALPHVNIVELKEQDLNKAPCAPAKAPAWRLELNYVFSPYGDSITVQFGTETLSVTPTSHVNGLAVYVIKSHLDKQMTAASATVPISWGSNPAVHTFKLTQRPCPAPAPPSWCRPFINVVIYFRLPLWLLPPACRS